MKKNTTVPIRRWLSLILALAMAASLAVTGAWAEDTEIPLANGDFSSGTDSWEVSGFQPAEANSWATNNTTPTLNLWLSNESDMEGSAAYTVSLEAGSYYFTFDLSGAESSSGLSYIISSGDTALVSGTEVYSTGGWDVWTTKTTESFTLDAAADVTFTLSGTVPVGYWGNLDNLKLIQTASSTPDPEEGYKITVTASETDPAVGDTVSLSAKVTLDGTEITDLATAGLQLWWWTDVWAEGHKDGLSDASFSNYDENSGNSLTADVTLPSEGTYYIVAELQDANSSRLCMETLTFTTVSENTEGYKVEVTASETEPMAGDTVSLTAKVTYNGKAITDLAAAGLQLWWWTDVWAEGHKDGLSDAAYSNYDENSGNSLTADVTLPSVGAYYIAAELQDSSGSLCTSFTTLQTQQNTYVTGDLDVDKIPGLDSDFIMGLDISSVVSEYASGVTFRDYEGNELTSITQFCQFLKSCGITHIRVRVWNDPYDSNGNGYGGGNNDINAAVEIARACASAGLKLLVDFHCSDFWADPSKQQTPKDWSGYTLEQKETAVFDFITDSLNRIAATGADIDMVQVGNETTGGFVGENSTANMCALFSSGSAAVRNFNASTKVVIHITNPEKSTMTTWAKHLDTYGVDYDILATSYYPYWHGTLSNLKSQFQTVRETYGKDVMVAETSYAYTLADSDGHENTVRVGSNDNVTSYPFTPQGQADCIRDIMAAVSEAGGLGVYYWEPAWITVGDTTGLTGDAYDAQVAANKEAWEKYGSGWASSYAGEYDPDDAGKWYGGSAVDNQAFFYPDGTPVASLHVWDYVKTGAVSNKVSVDSIQSFQTAIELGGSYTLPDTASVTYNKGTVSEPVTWDAQEAAAVDPNTVGIYVVHGTVTFSKEISDGDYAGKSSAETTYTLTVKEPNLITDPDDAGFERGNNFTIGGSGISSIPSADDPKEGVGSMHWWNTSATTGTVTYDKVLTLASGAYTFEAAAQGYAGDTVTLAILAPDGSTLFAGAPTELTGWAIWMTPSVTFTLTEETQIQVQVIVHMQDSGWGTVDCLYLHQHQHLAYADNGDGTHTVTCADCGQSLGTEPCQLDCTGLQDCQNGQPAQALYRCVCGAEQAVPLTAVIQGLPDQIFLYMGNSTDLVASFVAGEAPEGISFQASYASSDTSVLQVSPEGRLTPKGVGSCELTYSVLASVLLPDGTHTAVVATQTVPVTVAQLPDVVTECVVTAESILDGNLNLAGPRVELTGQGTYLQGQTVTLVAGGLTGYQFQGWYDSDGALLTDLDTFSFIVQEDTCLYASYTKTAGSDDPTDDPDDDPTDDSGQDDGQSDGKDDQGKTGSKDSKKTTRKGAATGDSTNPLPYVAILVLCGGAVIALTLYRRKKDQDNDK